MLSKRGSQARKSQSMKFLHLPRVVFFQLHPLTAGFGLPTLLLSGALENLHVASVSLRLLSRSARARLASSRLYSIYFREIGGRRSPEYDSHMRLPFYDIQDHVCSACSPFVLYFLTYKIIFLTLFIRRNVFFPQFCVIFYYFFYPFSG